MTRMKAERLEQAQSGMRLENRAQAKERSAPTPVTSDLMTVKEAAAYLRVSVWAIYDLTRQRGRVRMQLQSRVSGSVRVSSSADHPLDHTSPREDNSHQHAAMGKAISPVEGR